MRRTVFATALALLCAVPAAAQDALQTGRGFAEDFRAGRTAALWDAMTDRMRSDLGSDQALADLQAEVQAQAGPETGEPEEDVARTDEGLDVYTRTAEHETAPAPVVTTIALTEEGRIAGFRVEVQPGEAESAHLGHETQADLSLPFRGEWLVVWGGREIDRNYHAADRAQRFAYDFLQQEGGNTFRDDGQELRDYYCWNQQIVAPAAGRVVAMEAALPDNPPGETDRQNPLGNHVVLDLGTGEFAFLAHLQQGSIDLRPGDAVAQGEPIGTCGNSGNSSEPHLHFHLQTTPDLATGEGLPAQFQQYRADGEPVPRGEPLRGQVVTVM